MTRDPEQDPAQGPEGRLRLTPVGPLVSFGVGGLVLGWAQRPLTLRFGGDEPGMGWLPAVLLVFSALCLGWLAFATRRLLGTPGRLESHRAVNRMVLGKACGLVGSGVLGYAVGRLIGLIGITSEAAGQRMVQAGVAALAAVAVVAAALALERACLVRPGPDDDRRP